MHAHAHMPTLCVHRDTCAHRYGCSHTRARARTRSSPAATPSALHWPRLPRGPPYVSITDPGFSLSGWVAWLGHILASVGRRSGRPGAVAQGTRGSHSRRPETQDGTCFPAPSTGSSPGRQRPALSPATMPVASAKPCLLTPSHVSFVGTHTVRDSCVTLGSGPTVLCLSLPTCQEGAVTYLHHECRDSTGLPPERTPGPHFLAVITMSGLSSVPPGTPAPGGQGCPRPALCFPPHPERCPPHGWCSATIC